MKALTPESERAAALAVGLSWLAGSTRNVASSTQSLGGGAPGEEVLARLEADPRYRVAGELGRGGMGIVLRAHDLALGRDVALKAPRAPEEEERLAHEARITAQLQHPAVLPVYELVQGEGLEGQPTFFTMKLLEEHETLASVIERLAAGDPEAHRSYSFQRRVAIVQRLAQALDYAHREGVLHGDLKPSNVLLGTCGQVYLVDWGLAARTREGRAEPEDEETVLGTPLYMAPEQLLGEGSDARSEVYSLCALLYELLTLRHYAGEPADYGQLLHRVRFEAPPPADAFVNPIGGRVPRMLAAICARGLEKEPVARFESVEALERALQAWLEGRGPMFCPGTLLQRGLARWIHLVDQHTYLGPLVSYLGIGLGLGGVLAWGASLLS